MRVILEHVDDETLILHINHHEITATHDRHGWVGMELLDEVVVALRDAGIEVEEQ